MKPDSKLELIDWGQASVSFDQLANRVVELDLASANEAQTRFDVIDALIRNVLAWQTGQVKVEVESSTHAKKGYIDYLLKVADATLVIEAKKSGAAFPSPTKQGRLRLDGVILRDGEIGKAIEQAKDYANAKFADAVCVTNGLCWCIFPHVGEVFGPNAVLLFPFNSSRDAEKLFDLLAEPKVHDGSLLGLRGDEPTHEENRLIQVLDDADGRVNRNSIADHIMPALNAALYADALITNPESLSKNFIATEGRVKFDSLLGVHLADPKPVLVNPAPRIKTGKKGGDLERIVSAKTIDHAPPVTLIIGSVGSGKSTYLKHFELVSGKAILEKQNAHWIYIDFEEMGKAGSPREFLYMKLRDYLTALEPSPGNYESIVGPAYASYITQLMKGPLARIASDKAELDRRITDMIQSEYVAIEPYVDRIFRYLAHKQLCVFILDNIDLYEDEELENKVLAEGLAISKRLKINVIVSLRDRTFVRHRNTTTFDAYEYRKLWLDPPPFRPVLAARLTYSRKILEGHPAKIPFGNNLSLSVPDLGVFFEIVQRSVLQGPAGEYIEGMADLDVRKGLKLLVNFLTSGHIQADRALKNYIEGVTEYFFPFHEVFKGTVLGQFKFYKEARADCINIFDSRIGPERLKLLRLAILQHLSTMAKSISTLEVSVKECVELFASCGASATDVLEALSYLQENALIRTVTADKIDLNERIVITRSGGYYCKKLSHKFVYIEQCMLDTAIDERTIWEKLKSLTAKIESKLLAHEKMKLRRQRLGIFLDYLSDVETKMLGGNRGTKHLQVITTITKSALLESDEAVRKSWNHYIQASAIETGET